MKLLYTLLVLLLLSISTLLVSADCTCFEFKDANDDLFVFKLYDTAKITQARNDIATNGGLHVMGTIVKSPISYNPGWSYHLAPNSISFFEMAMEVCDSTLSYAEEHLDEVGGEFLPNNVICGWSTQLTRELSC